MGKLFYNNVVANIREGIIDNFRSDSEGTFINVVFENSENGQEDELEVKVVKSSVILDENGKQAKRDILGVGMVVEVIVSASILHGYKAQLIRVLSKPHIELYAAGVISEIHERSNSIDVICTEGQTSNIRFNISDETVILDRMGRTCNLGFLQSGMRVKIHHANIMTASIPPQTTAYEIKLGT